jgi:hypothetical protein
VQGVETLKILFTTHPADFQPLFQSAVREGGPGGSLSSLIGSTFGGGGYTQRDTKIRVETGGTEDWIALTRSFRLRRRASSRAAAEVAAGGRGL